MSRSIPRSARSRLLMACAVLCAATIAVTPAQAQILYGSIVGTVTDAQGANVPGATVTIVSKETNLTRDVTTDSELCLQPGDSIVLYTDGVTEAFDASNQMFGLPRLKEVVQKHAHAVEPKIVGPTQFPVYGLGVP